MELVAGEGWMLADELVNGVRDRIGKAFQNLDTQNVADKSEKRGRAMLINSAQ